MTIKTVTSEDARIRMRDMLDDVGDGNEIVIERYRRPAGVIINYKQWQEFKELKKAAMIAEARENLARASANPSSLMEHDDLVRLILEKRAHVDA
ncbi:hypothetical protein BH10CHL1_BH10CHL1_47840 [soil metagenome]